MGEKPKIPITQIEQVDLDTNWASLTLTNVTSGTLEYKVKNGLLMIKGTIVALTSDSYLQLATLPLNFRPERDRYCKAINISALTTSSENPLTNAYILTDGKIFVNSFNYSDWTFDIELTLNTNN